MRSRTILAAMAPLALLGLSACATQQPETMLAEKPFFERHSPALDELRQLPPAKTKLTAAVYAFTDQTGQNKPNGNFAEYSRAVTQGAGSILVQALERAGHHGWFQVLEREDLKGLLQERQIIRATYQEYQGKQAHPPIRPMLFAGIILDGGIIGYDSNTLTGGLGANYLGVGADTQYRRDTATVFLRAVSVSTGEVLTSVSASKTIYSVALNAGAFRFIGFKDLLQIEGGVTTNEPATLAVKQAIEKAVFGLIAEGIIGGHWDVADPAARQRLLDRYRREKGGEFDLAAQTLPPAAAVAPAPTQVPPNAAPVSRPDGEKALQQTLPERSTPPGTGNPATTGPTPFAIPHSDGTPDGEKYLPPSHK